MCVCARAWASHVLLVIKNSPANAGNTGDSDSMPGSGRFPGGGHGNAVQCSCLENLMDRDTWRDTVHRVAKSCTRPKLLSTHARVCAESCPTLCHNSTPWTGAQQAPVSMGFSRRERWGGLPFPSPGHLPDPGTESSSLALASGFLTGVGLMDCVSNSELVSGEPPSESIIHVHRSTLSGTLSPPRPLEYCVEVPVLYSGKELITSQ